MVTKALQGKCYLPGAGCKLSGEPLTPPRHPVAEAASEVAMVSVVFISSFRALLMTVQTVVCMGEVYNGAFSAQGNQAQGNSLRVVRQMANLGSLKRENIRRNLE